MNPLVTFVTRCCKRPKMLEKCVMSCEVQTDSDWEQLFIIDREGHGNVRWPNERLDQFKHYVRGKWVYILDDDCMLTEPTFVAEVRRSASQADIVMVRSTRPQKAPTLLPPDSCWGSRKRLKGAVNCLTYVVARELWQYHIAAFRGDAGSWTFMQAMLEANAKLAWLDLVVAETQQLGRGHRFEDCGEGWWERFIEGRSVIEVEEDVWRYIGEKE